ncbi:hypothetical protein F5Y10DRAFT_246523 [Nemania abortiva]|nr:hypothetical protein F5Y10DRAFT_246523 [Nemania abortiva]
MLITLLHSSTITTTTTASTYTCSTMEDISVDVSADVSAITDASTNVPLALPPLSPPACNNTPARMLIQHPGYRECRGDESLLLELPAVDYILEPSSQVRTWGLHHATILIACGIIANNAFSSVYLSYDPYGKKRVRTPRHGMLKSGDYWLQLSGREPPLPNIPSNRESTPTTRLPSPSPPPPPTSPSTSTSTPEDDNYYKYPIVPSFRDWVFPHNNLPGEWLQPHNLSDQSPRGQVANRCLLTDLQIGLEQCHIIPVTDQEWFRQNRMRLYCTPSAPVPINDQANTLLLKADLHRAFNNRAFVIIPKPSSSFSNSGPPLLTITTTTVTTAVPAIAAELTTAKPHPSIFAAHVLSGTPEARDFATLYHNVSIQTHYMTMLKPELFFARFAWALFPLLRNFLESKIHRHLVVIEKNKVNFKWMNSSDYKIYQSAQDASVRGSRKRRGGPSSQDEGLNDKGDVNDEDVYEERWRRRSASRKRWLSNYDRCRLSYRDMSEEGHGEDDALEEDDVDADVEDLSGLSYSFRTPGLNECILGLNESNTRLEQKLYRA